MKLTLLYEKRKVSKTEKKYTKDLDDPTKDWPNNKENLDKLKGITQPPGEVEKELSGNIWTKEQD